MTGRYIVKTQDDYFNVTDTYNNVPIVNGIRTEIEAEWLADHINTLNDEKDIITDDYTSLQEKYDELNKKYVRVSDEFTTIHIENMDLRKENYKLHKRLGDFEPFGKYIKERTSKIYVNDVIKTDEPINSVELKKELYK